MNSKHIRPIRSIRGKTRLPGDKSIGHRIALIGAIAEETTTAVNFPGGADCASTLACLEELGVSIERRGGEVRIEGRGIGGLKQPTEELDAGNSGTTVRLLSGILAGHPFASTIVGDKSLMRRPMERIIEPLRRFGATVDSTDGYLPLRIRGGKLAAIEYAPPIPSAQVKSAILLAGLHAQGTTSVVERFQTRDHTEIALRAFGANLRSEKGRVELTGGAPLRGRHVEIPGDLSSAAFLISAALILPESELHLVDVGVNPTRSSFLTLLQKNGGSISLTSRRKEGGEPIADIVVRASRLGPLRIGSVATPGLIDELPMLAVLGACTGRGATIHGAEELRFKESDRIHALVTNLKALGVNVREFEDGLEIEGGSQFEGGTVSSYGDHRIAMAFAIAGLRSRSGIEIEDPDCVDVSFPGFFETLERLAEP